MNLNKVISMNIDNGSKGVWSFSKVIILKNVADYIRYDLFTCRAHIGTHKKAAKNSAGT